MPKTTAPPTSDAVLAALADRPGAVAAELAACGVQKLSSSCGDRLAFVDQTTEALHALHSRNALAR